MCAKRAEERRSESCIWTWLVGKKCRICGESKSYRCYIWRLIFDCGWCCLTLVNGKWKIALRRRFMFIKEFGSDISSESDSTAYHCPVRIICMIVPLLRVSVESESGKTSFWSVDVLAFGKSWWFINHGVVKFVQQLLANGRLVQNMSIQLKCPWFEQILRTSRISRNGGHCVITTAKCGHIA